MIGVTQKSVLTLQKIVSMMANMDLTALAIHFYYMLSFQKGEKFWQIVLFNFFLPRTVWQSKMAQNDKDKQDNFSNQGQNG